MDVKREGVVRKKRIRLALTLVILLGALSLIGWRVSLLKPAAPSVERASVWIDAVKRGPMLRDVRGLGTLVPEQIVWIPATFDSQVSKVLVQSGEHVHPATVLLVLTNPDMELAANDLEWQVKQAQADYADLKVQLESKRLDQEASVSDAQSDLQQAELSKERDEALLKIGVQSAIEVKLSQAKWQELQDKCRIEKQRLAIMAESTSAQLDGKKVQIEKLEAAWNLKKQQVAQLTVRAGAEGILQEMTLEAGQRVKPGDVLAKVAQPRKLMARLQIPETQAKDIQLAQAAEIDTRNGVIPGHVMRIDPNVVNGTRTVDCKLDGPLPPGAVPDLSVDGTIVIERLQNVLYIGRPVSGQPDSQVGLFKVDADGKGASRVPVKLGRASVNSIEVLDGLRAGDQVILSDMSAQDRSERIRFN